MEIKTQFIYEGKKYDVTYRESDPDLNQEGIKMDGVHAYCFCNGKMVLVYNEAKKHWTPPGGAIEPGETWREATVREIKEESNMRVLHLECIGYQDILDGNRAIRQVRSFCIVEPYGDFVSDPDEDITKIALIDPKDFKQYFDWGKIGDRITERSLELLQIKKRKIEKNVMV